LGIVLGDRPWGSRSRSEARAGVGALCLHRRTHHSARAHAGKVRRRRACLRPAAPFGRRQERTGTPRTGTPRTQALRGHRHSEDTGTPRTGTPERPPATSMPPPGGPVRQELLSGTSQATRRVGSRASWAARSTSNAKAA
jgi:hypothetical protein